MSSELDAYENAFKERDQVYQIRLHGLGGEGVVTLSDIIGKTATRCGQWAHSLPFFGTEVRGAPVKAFARVSDSPISVKSYIYAPDFILITNDTLLEIPATTEGLKEDGVLLVNTAAGKDSLQGANDSRVYTINATGMAYEIFGRPIVNTILFGSLIAATDLFPLKAALEIISEEFAGGRAKPNIEAVTRGYEELRKVK